MHLKNLKKILEALPREDKNTQNYWRRATDQIMEDLHELERDVKEVAQKVLPCSLDHQEIIELNFSMDPFEELASKMNVLKHARENLSAFLDKREYDEELELKVIH